MNAIENVSRRSFLQTVVSSGALVLGAGTVPLRAQAEASSRASQTVLHPSIFLGVETDGTVYIVAHRSEMGTGVRTSLPRIVADELEADWNRVKVVQAEGNPRFGSQDTDGSHSVREFFDTMREAGAAARVMLVHAAAQQWSVPSSECQAELHTVIHKPTARKLEYGELASAAARLPVPKKEDLQFKPRSAWRYIGKDAKNYDVQDFCTGKPLFGMDVRRDGMVYAAIAHPPVLGGRVTSVDDKAALQVMGVKQTVAIEPFHPPHAFQALGGVAVIADNTFAAFKGRKKLKVVWDNGANRVYSSDPYKKQLQETARKPARVVRNVGDVDAEFAKGGKVIEAEYYTPHLAHASMESVFGHPRAVTRSDARSPLGL